MYFNQQIINWYHLEGRALPWRKTKNPYFIWISEIILQQTRVEQGLPYYEKFIFTFPDIFSLANAKEQEVLQIWQGLGYYSRARNMHICAKEIVQKYNGKFPETYSLLIQLKGIGPYTAAAIASFAFGEKKAVVDGNVLRLIARYLGVQSPVNEKEGLSQVQAFVDFEILNTNPADFNQAIMEMGAMICRPKLPICSNCVLNQNCFALKHHLINTLPIKTKKIKIRKRYFNYFMLKNATKLPLTQRTEKDIWTNLYEFPMIETTEDTLFPNAKQIGAYKHILTHQRIEAKLWIVNEYGEEMIKKNPIFEVELETMQNSFPVHQLMIKMIKTWQHQ